MTWPKLTPEMQAEVAEWLARRRSQPDPPIAEYELDSIPVAAVFLAFNRRLMGVTRADLHRILQEGAWRMSSERRSERLRTVLGPPEAEDPATDDEGLE